MTPGSTPEDESESAAGTAKTSAGTAKTPAAPLAVTGIGLITPAGTGTEETWERVCSGRPTAAPDPELAGLPVDFSCRVREFDPRVHAGGAQPWRNDRFTQLALAAAREAVTDADLASDDWDGTRTAIVLGSAAGGVGTYEAQHHKLLESGPRAVSPLTLPGFLPNMAAGRLAIELRATGPVMHTSTACASGASALITAALLLRSGACDIAVAGGADAMVTPACSAAFARMGALSERGDDPVGASRPFDARRDGFVLAEGAGVLVLERQEDAAARGVPAHALFAGHGSTADAHDPVAPHPQGLGLRRAIRLALASADADADAVDHVNAHGTGTPLNDRAETSVLREELAPGARSTVTSAKGVLGHTMGAAGAIEAALTALTVERQLAPPTANFGGPDAGTAGIDVVAGEARRQRVRLALSNSCGFGGHNTVLAFRPAA